LTDVVNAFKTLKSLSYDGPPENNKCSGNVLSRSILMLFSYSLFICEACWEIESNLEDSNWVDDQINLFVS